MTFNVAGDLTAQFVNPVADSRNTTINSVDVAFSRPIDGRTLSIADFQLTRNGQIVPLTGAQTVTFVSGTTYRIGNLAALTRQQGNDELSINTRGISDTTGHPGTTTVSEHWLMDTVAPSSRVNPLPAYTSSLTLQVTWGGTDSAGGSGLVKYDIYVSDNGGSFQAIAVGTTKTSTLFKGVDGHQYEIYSVATDRAGNRQLTRMKANTKTTIRR